MHVTAVLQVQNLLRASSNALKQFNQISLSAAVNHPACLDGPIARVNEPTETCRFKAFTSLVVFDVVCNQM